MRTSISRRLTLLATTASLVFGVLMPARAQAPATAPAAVERHGAGQTLQDLYQAALKEGGALTSSMEFASKRLSLPFSDSRAFKRCASLTFMPPSLAFQA
jgi:hypothetical protein